MERVSVGNNATAERPIGEGEEERERSSVKLRRKKKVRVKGSFHHACLFLCTDLQKQSCTQGGGS